MKTLTRLIAFIITFTAIFGQLNISANEDHITDNGEGSCIAILSSGFMTGHESFIITSGITKLTKSQSDTLFLETRASKLSSYKTASAFVSEKIPFAYDYGDGDTDVFSKLSSDTGTAMISACAGNDGYEGADPSARGIAPEAQILAMKIYSDKKSTVTADAMAMAIEDSVLLGADVILITETVLHGTLDKSFTDTVEAALKAANDAGVAVICPVGDAMPLSDALLYADHMPGMPTYLPDRGNIAYPASSDLVFSVGNAVSNKLEAPAFLLNGSKSIMYSDTNAFYEAPTGYKTFGDFFNGRELEYVFVEGVGKLDQMKAAGDLSGKLVLVNRGELSFSDKAKNAAMCGAVGIIVVDTQMRKEDTLKTGMNIEESPIPAILVSIEDGAELKNAEVKKITPKSTLTDTLSLRQTPSVNSSSAFGTSSELKIKPDITVVGTDVECLISDGSFATFDSTLISAAKTAGMYAILRSRLKAERPELDKIKLMNTAYTYLASVAELLISDSGELYSPRAQGTGCADPNALSSVSAVLSSDGKHKIDLGDKNGQILQFNVTAENVSDKAMSYTLDAVIGSDSFTTYSASELDSDLYEWQQKISEMLGLESDGEASFIGGFTEFTDTRISLGSTLYQLNDGREDYKPFEFTLLSGSSMTFNITIHIDEATYKTYSKYFENGFFAEGFVRLTADDGTVTSIPYSGFCGNFAACPAADAQYLENGQIMFDEVYIFRYTDDEALSVSSKVILGENDMLSNGEVTLLDSSTMAFSPYADSKNAQLFLNLPLLRTVENAVIEITDADGNVVSSVQYGTILRTAPYKFTANPKSALIPLWNGRADDYYEYVYPEGYYTVSVRYNQPGSKHLEGFEYTLFLDLTTPVYEGVSYEMKNGVPTLTVKASDNHGIRCVTVTDGSMRTAKSDDNVSFDITGLIDEYIYIDICDNALNSTVVRIKNPVIEEYLSQSFPK